MAAEYSVEICNRLEQKFYENNLHRPMRVARYDAGAELEVDATSVGESKKARLGLVIEKFVGGGFAGQVYRVKVTKIQGDGPIGGLEVGGTYAMKILIPPSNFARLFRNVLYWVGFQGPFQIQVNPTAARAGALWQKFIRRAAKLKFGSETVVNDVHATFVDTTLGSCAELSDWVDGRTWRLEVDDNLDTLGRWSKGRQFDPGRLGSPEYRAKKQFMADFVELLHDLGAHEFARQYEWWTCKSQPNCLKYTDTNNDPSGGLVAVDFRAGLTLVPFLPMSPGDCPLIIKGLARGSIVQFDRGSVCRLERFVESHRDGFADMLAAGMLDELKSAERVYRDSQPDITHNHVRLFYSPRLWSTMMSSAVTGWQVRNLVDEPTERKLRNSKILTLLFFMVGIVPLLGRLCRRIWARPDWRRHYGQILTSWGYVKRSIRGIIDEKLIVWRRAGRVDDDRAIKLAEHPGRFFCHWPLSILPAGLHRFSTDRKFRREKLAYIFVRPIRLYFNAELREQWLRDMVAEGQKKYILSAEDAQVILSQINEPFIQKYLKSLAVHVCTLPVTQVVSVLIALIYILAHPEMPWKKSWGIGIGIVAFFQVVPISPGSICRGAYVLYLVIRERNFKDYNIAVFLGFFKYVGYLAFPIQMTYHYPALARFMAGHWATEAVHIVPVFGEGGALFEHWIFRLFYNWPLTVRRRMSRRAELRAAFRPRYWHVGVCALVGAAIFGLADFIYLDRIGQLPGLKEIWWIVVLLPAVLGALVTLGCAGAVLWKRIIAAAVCGGAVGLLYTTLTGVIGSAEIDIAAWDLAKSGVWCVFIFTILTTIGAIITEMKLPDPDLR